MVGVEGSIATGQALSPATEHAAEVVYFLTFTELECALHGCVVLRLRGRFCKKPFLQLGQEVNLRFPLKCISLNVESEELIVRHLGVGLCELWAQSQDFWEEGIEEFTIEGRFEKNLLYIVGRRHGESFVATYNTLVKGDTLVGTWTGKDRNGEPISAPAVLSPRELQVPDLRNITAMAMLRFIQNSERGFLSQLTESTLGGAS